MPSRYMTAQKERKVTNPPKQAVGGVSGEKLKNASVKASFPTCYGSGGTFGAFQRKAMP